MKASSVRALRQAILGACDRSSSPHHRRMYSAQFSGSCVHFLIHHSPFRRLSHCLSTSSALQSSGDQEIPKVEREGKRKAICAPETLCKPSQICRSARPRCLVLCVGKVAMYSPQLAFPLESRKHDRSAVPHHRLYTSEHGECGVTMYSARGHAGRLHLHVGHLRTSSPVDFHASGVNSFTSSECQTRARTSKSVWLTSLSRARTIR